jgi:DNA polymerase-3 subunit epsilon
LLYAVVDIETTGSYAAANGITEIAICITDGTKILAQYETLINPGQPIPYFIQSMTGITDAMVQQAPRFEAVAEKIYTLLQDKIFVAHNVSFDYSFVLSHLKEAGYALQSPKLCTVRLARKIIPGYPSYSLGKLCRSLHISVYDRHRAGGDCAATVQLLHLLIEKDVEGHIGKSLKKNSKEWILPPNVPKEHFDKLPYTPGVYYFHNAKGKVVYVGKANNLRYRVNSHFSNNSQGRQKQNFMQHVHAITYKECATELMACILESVEIKKRWPIFNASQKRWEDVYGIYVYEDQNGYLRLAIDKKRKRLNPVYTFHYLVDGHAVLRKLISEHQLCPVLCFMQKNNTACVALAASTCSGACAQLEAPALYNERVNEAIAALQNKPSYAIVDKGIEPAMQSCILVCDGQFYGMGYVPAAAVINDINWIKEQVTLYRENSYIRNMVMGYASRFPDKIVMLSSREIVDV